MTRTPGLYYDIPDAEYHDDADSLSVHGAQLVLQAPALYRWRLENPEYRDEYDIGTVAHKVVLGIGPDIQLVDADDWRSKLARDTRDAARRQNKVPILVGDWQRICDMADVLSRHPFASQLLADGKPEVSAYAVDEETGIMRRGRVDILGADAIVDYKTTSCAEPGAFAVACARYGYDMQADWYLWLIEHAADYPRDGFAFIAQEKTPPYLVEVYELDDDALERGYRRNRRALERYLRCVDTDEWPGYTGVDYSTLSLPKWAYAEDR